MYVTEPLNVRTGPNTNYEICNYLSTNDEVNVIGICDNNWFQILINNKEALDRKSTRLNSSHWS